MHDCAEYPLDLSLLSVLVANSIGLLGELKSVESECRIAREEEQKVQHHNILAGEVKDQESNHLME